MLGIRCCAAVRNSGVSFTSGLSQHFQLPAYLFSFSTVSPPFCLLLCRVAFDVFEKSKESVSEKRRGMFYPPTQSHALVYGCTLPETGTSAQRCSVAVLWAAVATTWEMVFVSIWFWVAAWKRCLTPARWRRCSPRRRTERVQKLLLCVFHVCWSCVNALPQGCTWKRVLLLSTLFIAVCEFVHVNSCLLYLLAFFFSSLGGRRGYGFTLLAGWVGKSL